jgi:hypothetical protein
MRVYLLLIAMFPVALQSLSLAGSIEKVLGGEGVARRTLESLSYSDLNSRALDSFVEGVGHLARHPDLSSLPTVQIGRRTVSLEALSPLVEMAKKLTKTPASQLSSSTSPLIPSHPSAQYSMSVLSPTSSFALMESALEASPLPASTRADLTRMVRSIKDFTGSR